MATTTYPLMTVIDDNGTITAGATVTITSVTDKSGTAISSPGATVNQAGANVSVDYDATAKGEAWIVLSISKSGSTFSGLNASPAFYLAVPASGGGGGGSDTPGTTTLLTRIPGVVQPQTGDSYARLGAPVGASLSADIQTRSTYAGGDTSGVTTLLGRVTGTVALASQIPGDFTSALFASSGVFASGALANIPATPGAAALAAFAKLIVTGTVTSVTNGGSFAVTFDAPFDGNAASLTGGTLRLSFSAGLNHLQSAIITAGTMSDSTHASLTFLGAFTQTVQVGDTFAILSN